MREKTTLRRLGLKSKKTPQKSEKVDERFVALAQTMKHYVDPIVQGPIVFSGQYSAIIEAIAEALKHDGVKTSRFVFLGGTDEVKELTARFDGSIGVITNELEQGWVFPALQDAPVSAFISCFPLNLTSGVKRNNLLAEALKNLHPMGRFICFGGPSQPIRHSLNDLEILGSRTRIPFSELVWSYGRRSNNKKIDGDVAKPVALRSKHQKSEGLIAPDHTSPVIDDQDGLPRKLPKRPAKLWPGGLRGKTRDQASEALFSFLRATYGKYLPRFRDELRSYIFHNDPKLYQAVMDYERRSDLPDDLQMTSVRDRVQRRLRRAFNEGMDTLSRPERRSVTGKLARDEKLKLK